MEKRNKNQKTKTVPCSICNKLTKRTTNQINRAKREHANIYCSKKCHKQHCNKIRKVKTIILPCGICKKPAKVTPGQFKYWRNVYCSPKCRKKQQSRRSMECADKNNHRITKTKTCVICKKVFKRKESLLSSNPQKTCGNLKCQRAFKLKYHLLIETKCKYCDNTFKKQTKNDHKNLKINKVICGAIKCKKLWESQNKQNRRDLTKVENTLFHQQNAKCRRCKKLIRAYPSRNYERDHILPVTYLVQKGKSRAEINSPKNIALLCIKCHRQKPQHPQKAYNYVFNRVVRNIL